MYNKLSPFISLGLRRFPPSALQQVLVWWGLSDGISAGCVVGINDLLKAICPPKVAHSSTCSPTICSSWQLPQWQDPLQYSVWPWSVWVCVCLIWSCLSPCDGERQLFFVLALQELRWSVCVFVCVCGRAEKNPMKLFESCYITSYVKLDWFLQCYKRSLETSRVACVGRLCTGTLCVQGCITLI